MEIYSREHGQKHEHEHHRHVEHVCAPSVLIVDDEVEAVKPLQIVLTQMGFDVWVSFDGREALRALSNRHFDAVFLDMALPDLRGEEVLKKFEAMSSRLHRPTWLKPKVPIIVYSAYDPSEVQLPTDSNTFFVYDFWKKPLTLPETTIKTANLIDVLNLKLPTTTKGGHHEYRY